MLVIRVSRMVNRIKKVVDALLAVAVIAMIVTGVCGLPVFEYTVMIGGAVAVVELLAEIAVVFFERAAVKRIKKRVEWLSGANLKLKYNRGARFEGNLEKWHVEYLEDYSKMVCDAYKVNLPIFYNGQLVH